MIENRTFEVGKAAVKQEMPRYVLRDYPNTTIETYVDHIHDALVYHMETKFLTPQTHYETVTATVTVPLVYASRWNYFKAMLSEDLSNGYFIKKFWLPKIKVHTERYENSRTFSYYTDVCPHINVPDSRTHIEWLIRNDDNIIRDPREIM